MYLKALEIQGFKSFPDKTVLNFGEDVTAIVGPNGSGKSNVSDAIRWVMGEQSTKSLRGSKMEDVIFGGTEKRSQTGFAQVTLVLDNTEHIFPQMEESEVAVTRRYDRSGESEYYINKQRVRLSDISELFMDTGMGREGYSIIGQGRIDEILSQKSADRREIFEEAAGIAKYRHRKESAEHDLDRTQENLTRVNDKISELEPQVERQREQAEKAKQFNVLSGELRTLEISIWIDQLDSIRANAIKIENNLNHAQRELDDVKAACDDSYAASGQFSERVRDNDLEQERVRALKAELEKQLGEQESAIAVRQTDIAHNEESIRNIEEELSDQSGRAGVVEGQIAEDKARITQLDGEIAGLEAALETLTTRMEELSNGANEAASEAERARAQELLARQAAADCRSDISAARSSISENEERRTALAAEREQVEQQLGDIKKAATENRRALEDAQEDADAIENIIKGHTMKMEGRVKREKEAEDRRLQLTMELNNLDTRIKMLSDMEKEYEGFSKSVRVVMQAAESKALRGVHGPVANLMETDKKYAVALEIALGAKLQDIVVDREEDAKAAINLLKQRDSGRATFQPLTAIRGAELRENGLESEYGFVGVASQLVRCEDKYRAVFASMLGNTVVVEDIDCAIAVARKYQHRFRIVTLDGQVINRGGSMTGGSIGHSAAGILSRANELKELSAKRGSLAEKLDAARREADEAKRDHTAAQYELEVAQSQQQAAKEKVLKLSGDKDHYDVLLSAARDRLDGMDAEDESIDRRVAEQKKLIAEREKLAAEKDAEAEKLKADADRQLSGQSELMKTTSALGEEITEKKSALSGNRAERESTERLLHEHEALREQLQGDEGVKRERIGQYRAANEKAHAEIEELEARIEALGGEKQSHEDALKKLNDAKLEIERERGENDKRMKELNEHVVAANNVVANLQQQKDAGEAQRAAIIDKLWENYGLSHSAAMEQRIEIENTAKATRRIAELKRGINALGTVNVAAIEEYELLNGRYTMYTTQRDDIERAKEELLGIIENITGEMTNIFREQFHLIRTSFEETFLELFGGGKATLELEDENDVLNCGIEIKVQPPGKALKTLTLLSGGEKAFVAIALYFAILKVHPTPFCVMDEIEAALDAANVIRVANYMRRISDKTQFIVITHRPETMESADILYGVTMQERGVSKVLKLSMNDITKELGIKE